MQIDVVEVNTELHRVTCSLYTGDRCVRIYMSTSDYAALIRDGFFIRDGRSKDSANILNTTLEYQVINRDGK